MPTRRDFLKMTCGAAAVALGPVLLADTATAADGIKRMENGQVVVTVAKVAGLAKVGGSVNLGNVNGVPVAVVRTGAKSYEAISRVCQHKGGTVARSGSGWECPRHGSRYDLDGDVTGGPSTRSLPTVRSRFDGTRLVVG